MSELLQVWNNTWHKMQGKSQSSGVMLHAQLMSFYTEPHRKYHTTQHLQECFDLLVKVAHLAERPEEIAFALWFHDAFYYIGSVENEQMSAQWAYNVVQALCENGMPDKAIRVYDLVKTTSHAHDPKTEDGKLIADIDLAILAAKRRRYNEYEKQIRQEYEHVSDEDFNEGRGRFMRQMLNRPHIYHTPYFRHHFETKARHNIEKTWGKTEG